MRGSYETNKMRGRQTTDETKHLHIYFQVGLLARTLRSAMLASPEKLSIPSVLGLRAFPAAPSRADNRDILFGLPGDRRAEDSTNTLFGPALTGAVASWGSWGI